MVDKSKFKDAKILVVGDVMLDNYYYGEVLRISPEAPVPVVEVLLEAHLGLFRGARNCHHGTGTSSQIALCHTSVQTSTTTTPTTVMAVPHAGRSTR